MKKFMLAILGLVVPVIVWAGGVISTETMMIGSEFTHTYRGQEYNTFLNKSSGSGYGVVSYTLTNEGVVSVSLTQEIVTGGNTRRTDRTIKVLATSIGSTILTVKTTYYDGNNAKSITDTYKINVVDVTSIAIPNSLSLYMGDTYTFSPIISMQGATTSLTWQSSNTSVGTIDGNGSFRAVGVGTTTILCTAYNGVSAQCQVTVNPIMVNSITLNETEAELCVGDKLQLSAMVLPTNATIPGVTWKSSDESVAHVDESGQVTAVKSGYALITAAATDGSGKTASCNVKVLKNNKLTVGNVSMCQGGTGTMHVLLTDEDVISGFQFDLALPEGVSVATNTNGQLQVALTDRTSNHSISADKVAEGLYRFIVVSLSGKPITQGEGDVMTITLEADANIGIGDYIVTAKDIELTVKDGTTYTQVYPRDNTARLAITDLLPGDVTGDNKVTVTDVISIISYILGEEPVLFIKTAADVNGDEKVSVTDAISVIDFILNNK